MPPLVAIEQLTKRYGEFVAVDRITLNIPPASIFALLGPNGAGKTTTIKILMGMLCPTSGSLRVCGMDAFRDSVAVKARVGYLPDEPEFYDFMHGREILRFCGEMHGLSRRRIDDRIESLAERLQLADALDDFAQNYSRGMKKKLGLMCALLHEPPLVVLDEPTNGLDPHSTQVLHDLMRELAAEGRTVLFSTHLLDQAERLCDHVAIIHQGRLAAVGTLEELREQCGSKASLEDLFFQLTSNQTSTDSRSDMTSKEAVS